MEEDKSISPAQINQIAWDVLDDEADPEEVRELLEYICKLVDRQEQLSPVILRYVRDSLRRFLDGSTKSLNGAFGLKKRKPGRRKVNENIRLAMATEILRYRLDGGSHRGAVDDVAARFCKSESVISDAWAARKQDALIALRLERDLETFPWSEEEIQRLEEIFEKEQRFLKEKGYLAPEK